MRDDKLVLSLFPGLGRLDRAFEEAGYTVVRGPDLLWGGDNRRFHARPGIFAGLIGGPPCQSKSTAGKIIGTDAVDLIPDFVRVFNEGAFLWAVMENVAGHINHPAVPRDWHPAILRDWDCGGETARKRAFWTWPFMVMDPVPRPGEPAYSVMASTAKRGGGQYVADKGFLPGDLPLEEYERLQGCPGITAGLVDAKCGRYFAVHVLGNGVPLSMGRYIARAVKSSMGA
jgi:DNA (cytosine-5)-methyltransferase 1